MYTILFLLWLVCNGRITFEIIWIGLLLVAVLAVFMRFFLDITLQKDLWFIRKLPLLIAYIFLLIWEVFKSNVSVIHIVFCKSRRVDQSLVTFDAGLKTDFGRFLLANSITLTPGTITVNTEGNIFTVHCLSREMIDGITTGSFAKLIRRMEA